MLVSMYWLQPLIAHLVLSKLLRCCVCGLSCHKTKYADIGNTLWALNHCLSTIFGAQITITCNHNPLQYVWDYKTDLVVSNQH